MSNRAAPLKIWGDDLNISDFVFTELRKMLTEKKFIKIVTFFVEQKGMRSLVLTA